MSHYRPTGEERYIYNCRTKWWTQVKKQQLFHRQYNFLFKSKLFRIDSSLKIKQQDYDLEEVKKMFMQEGKWNKVLRFKKMRVYKVN